MSKYKKLKYTLNPFQLKNEDVLKSNKEFLITKPFTFHGTKKDNLDKILKEGLKPSGGVYGTFVYTKLTPNKTLYSNLGTDSIVIIDTYGYMNENEEEDFPFVYDIKKDWILFPNQINESNILGIIKYIKNENIVDPVVYEDPSFQNSFFIFAGDLNYGNKLFNKKVNQIAKELFEKKYGLYTKIKIKVKHFEKLK
jgi:hypothetical protein